MFHKYFKQTMDFYGIEGKELAAKYGCSPQSLSNIRGGRSNPSIEKFWKLIQVADLIAPGAKTYFGNLIVNNETPSTLAIDPVKLIESLNENQLAQINLAISKRLENLD